MYKRQQLTVPGMEDIYIVGDCAAFIETGQERPYPTTAQIANQMGAYVGARISGKPCLLYTSRCV